jgi:Fic family protein
MSIKYSGLFELLEAKGISKTQLQKKLRFSSATMAKLTKNEPVSMKIIEGLCKELNCQPGDIIRIEKKAPLNKLLQVLQEEKEMKLKGGIYHQTQIKLAYNSNRMEGSRLSEDQTRYIYETNTVEMEGGKSTSVDDIIETVNHFQCFDYLLDHADDFLTESIIKEFHKILKSNTSDGRKEWFKVGDYKTKPNMVGDKKTTPSSKVKKEMAQLLEEYHEKKRITFEDIMDFHYCFEAIHPFQDGNGRVGRLIMFKECLKHNITPFIIDDRNKVYYYRGLNEYLIEKGYLTETCLSAQDNYAETIHYFMENEK